jgi:DNA-binding Lrp family transcriptional regulator
MSERVKRLEERGIIRGYGARIDPVALGLGMVATSGSKRRTSIYACLKQFEELPFVIEVYRVTGDDCFILKAIVPAPENLASIVDAIGRFGSSAAGTDPTWAGQLWGQLASITSDGPSIYAGFQAECGSRRLAPLLLCPSES